MIAQELLQGVHEQLEALVTGQDWLQLLNQASRWHTYSFANQLLIFSQCPDATQVAGYKAWKALNRYVKHGEKGIAILAPMVYKEKDDTGKDQRVVRGFRVVYVFDASQTEGEPLAKLPRPVLLEGQAPEFMREFLVREIQKQGYVVRYPGRASWVDFTVNGYTNFATNIVAISPHLSEAQQAKTLAHELGHITLQHQKLTSRELAEVEAESFAAVLMMSAGVDSMSYTLPYIAGWSGGDMKLVMATATKVVAFANMTIIDWADYSTQLMLQF